MANQTILEINAENLKYNLDYFRSLLGNDTKVMVMAKAFGYGLGNPQLSQFLEIIGVDYLGVALVQEGVDLRKAGIKTPIFVMNPQPDQFSQISDYQLEPEIYSMRILSELDKYVRGNHIPVKVHLKVETGMHRLGLEPEDLDKMCTILKNNELISVVGILSHLSSAEMVEENDFTLLQIKTFDKFVDSFLNKMGLKVSRHLLNTAGILFYPQYQYEMVRLGIGLYGVDRMENRSSPLKTVCSLKSVISQVKTLRKGDSVGYGRAGLIHNDHAKIATIAMGYADGFYRSLGNGNYSVWINGQWAKTIGNICMDMFMVDVTELNVAEGEIVEIFGEHQPVEEMAKAAKTIPYEVFTSIGERVKRVFV